MSLPDLNLLRIFTEVVEAGSFTRAAERLHISKGAVSRQVTALEEALGARLLNRTTRTLSLTREGAAVLDHAKRAVDEARFAAAAASELSGKVTGVLKVSAPISFTQYEFGEALPEFMERYPDLTVEIDLADHMIDFVSGGYDVGIRISGMADSSLIARQLAPVRRFICAAPSYIEKFGAPRTLDDLSHHACIINSQLPDRSYWTLRNGQGQVVSVPVSGRFIANTSVAIQPVVLAGLGLQHVPDFIAYRHLKSGALVRVLEEEVDDAVRLHLIYADRRHMPSKVRAFVDFMVEKYGEGRAPWIGV